MPNTSYAQTSFLGGEWSQSMQGRFDRPDYRTGMNRALNCMPIASGMNVRRPGTRYAGHTKAGRQARMIKFDFQQADPYTMEFTDSNLRFFSGANLVTTNDDKAVVSISAANPAVVTVASHSWANGSTVVFKTLGTGTPLLQNRQFTITTLSGTTFSLQDAITGANIDGATLGTLATSAVVGRVLDLPTTITAAYLQSVRSVQEKTQAFLLNGALKPQVLTATPKTALTDYATFSLSQSFFQDGPYLDPVGSGLLLTPSATNGIISAVPTYPTYAATKAYTIGDLATVGGVNYVSLQDANLNNNPPASPTFWAVSTVPTPIGPNGFQGSDVGRHVRLYSEPADFSLTTAYVAGNLVKYANVYWVALAGSTGKPPGTDTTNWAISTTAARWTWGIITALSNFISAGTGTSIGDMTSRGGLAAAFDGNTAQTFSNACARLFYSGSAVTLPTTPTTYVGKNYSASGGKQIASAMVYPINTGFLTWSRSAGATPTVSMVLNLRAKATAPASSSDGTLLGSVATSTAATAPISITSSDAVTAWNYVWVEMAFTFAGAGASTLSAESYISEVAFFNPIGVASGVNIELLGGDLLYTVPIRTWRLGVYSDTTGWPTCGCYHEGRLFLAGAQGNRIDASMSNKPQVFSPTDLTTGAVADSNGLSYIFNSNDVNAIFWLEPDQQGVLAGTQAGEWCVQANTNNVPLTPTNMQAHRVTTIGCANMAPVRADHTLIFGQKAQRKVVEFFSDISYGRFSSTDITEKFRHLTATIVELAYQPELSPVVWMRRADGTLIGCTYRREAMSTSQPPMFAAGHRHTLGSGRTVESISVGASVNGTLPALYMVTTDASGIRHVEIMTDIPDETAPLSSAWYLDDAVAPSSYTTTFAACTFNGLWHLNGKTVSVFAGGLDCGDVTVSNGQAVVTFGDGVAAGAGQGLFTQDFVAAFNGAMPCVIGFSYTTQGQMVRPALQAEAGTAAGPAFGKIRRSHQYGVMLVNSRAPQIGTDFSNLRTAQIRTPGGSDYSALTAFTGMHVDTLEDDYTMDSMLAWQQTRPLPCNIAALGAYLSTQDK